MNHRYTIQLKNNRLTKTSLNKKQKKYEHKRRRRVDEQDEQDTISKDSEDIMDLESSKEHDSEVQQFDEHPKPWRDGFYCLFKDSAYESDDSNLDMYAEGDGLMPLLEKWVGFKEIGEFTEIIIKDGPLKGTVNEKGPYPNIFQYPLGNNNYEVFKRDTEHNKPNVYRSLGNYIFQNIKDDDKNPTEVRESINFDDSMDYSSTHGCHKE